MIISCRDHFHYVTHCLLQESRLVVVVCCGAFPPLVMYTRASSGSSYPLNLLMVFCSPGFFPTALSSDKILICTFDLEPVQKGQQCLILYYCEMTRSAWFTGLLRCSDPSPPYLTAMYFMALSRGIQAVDLQDHLLFKNLNPTHPINPFLIDLWQLKIGFRLTNICSKFVLLITYFRAVYVGRVAL